MSNGTLKKLSLLGNDWEDDGLEVRGGYESDRFGCHGGWWMRSLGDPCFSMFFLNDLDWGERMKGAGEKSYLSTLKITALFFLN